MERLELIKKGVAKIQLTLSDEEQDTIFSFIEDKYTLSHFMCVCAINEVRFPTGVLEDKSTFSTCFGRSISSYKFSTISIPVEYKEEIYEACDGKSVPKFMVATALKYISK